MAGSWDTSPSEVTVGFAVQTGLDSFVLEPDPVGLALDVADYRAVPGRLEIRSAATPPVLPEDELVPLVMNLCFRAVARLHESPHAVVGYTDTYGYLRLDAEGRRIRLSGDRVPDVRVPGRPLVEALVACGRRFVGWLPQLDLTGDVGRICRDLEGEAAAAQAALDAGLLA